MRRRIIEGMEVRKNAMIAALWSNSNWDDDKGSRGEAIEELENNFDEAVAIITTGHVEGEEEIDKDNPFFSAAERGKEKLFAGREDEGTVGDVVGEEQDYSKYIDQ